MPSQIGSPVLLLSCCYAFTSSQTPCNSWFSHSPLAIYGSKVMLNYSRDHGVADSLEYMATWQSGMFHPVDMMETFAAKKEQRETNYDPLMPIEKVFPENK